MGPWNQRVTHDHLDKLSTELRHDADEDDKQRVAQQMVIHQRNVKWPFQVRYMIDKAYCLLILFERIIINNLVLTPFER